MIPGDHRSAARLRAALDDLLTSRPPLPGGGRLVCVDGRSGSGKTVLVQSLHDVWTDSVVVRVDDFVAGWDGLDGTPQRIAAEILEPLARGRAAEVLPWDWDAGTWSGAPVVVAPPGVGQVLVLEGVGAGSRCCTSHASALVWCEAPDAVRRDRALARDDDFGVGHRAAEQWRAWAAQEDHLLARERTPERADLTWLSDA